MVTLTNLLTTVIGAGGYDSAVRAIDGVLAWWPLAGNLEPSVGGSVGQPSVAPTYEVGPLGKPALRLPGGGFINLGDLDALDTPALSAALFFRLDGPAPGGHNPCLLAKREDSPRTRFSVHVRNDFQQFAIWNGGAVAWFDAPDGTPLEIGRWYHLTLVGDGGQARLYLDGAPCDPVGGTAPLNVGQTGHPLLLGASAPDGAETFGGVSLAELVVWGAVLGDEAVASLVDSSGGAERRQALVRAQLARAAERRRLEQEREEARQRRVAERLADTSRLERGARRVYTGDHLNGIYFPAGGIGTGLIQVNGAAELEVWQIFNQHAHSRPPESFLAIRAGTAVRALQGAAAGPFAAMAETSFSGEYPFGWWTFRDPALPGPIELTILNPLIPHQLRDSSIPCVMFEVTCRNDGAAPATVEILGSLLNCAGYPGVGPIEGRAHAGFRGCRNETVAVGDGIALHAVCERPATDPGFGELTLLAAGAPNAVGVAQHDGLDALHAAFAAGNLVAQPAAGPAPDGTTLAGAVAVPLTIPPGETRRARFVLAWWFPNASHGAGGTGWEHTGNFYATIWPDSLAVAAEVADRFDELTDASRRFHDSLYETNLPWWLVDRLSSQLGVLRSKTCWQAADGYFGGWEGCSPENGCCHGNCGHVWHYAQTHARLWPELGRRMREQALSAQREDGALFFRQPTMGIAADGLLGELLATWREALLCGDDAWLAAQYPAVRKALDWAITTWDPDLDGLFAGPQHNTLDAELSGACSWMGTLYLAALEACARMADRVGAGDGARWRSIREVGARLQNERLYNGEYYIQVPEAVPQRDYNNGCHIDQLLGEWWADQLDLPWAYPLDRKQSALRALLAHNFQPEMTGVEQSPRKFVADEDAGLQMITWPRGGRPANHMLYASECMTGFEYSAAAAMLQHGLEAEAMLVLEAIAIRYDGRRRVGLTGGGFASWGYSGNPFGDDECGKYYARAMSIWSVLLAAQGFHHDAAAGALRFAPRWRPEDHVSFFSTAEGYGVFTQRREAGRTTQSVRLDAGRLTLRQLVLPAGGTTLEIALRPGAAIQSEAAVAGDQVTLTFEPPLELAAGTELTVASQ